MLLIRSVIRLRAENLRLIVRRRSHKFCIIGSGPAGFYAAQQLLKLSPSCSVDIFERLPVPFGLVRYGVAPDHPEVKNVTHTFTNILKNERVQFIGNFEAGKDISLTKLREAYHGVLLAYGASEDRKLNIQGEDLILSARDFVGWYNGLPENRDLHLSLKDKSRAVIIGQGNVALDIARILLTPVNLLERTDISPYALEALKKSGIKEVLIIGRRGPLQVSFTIKELRELVNLEGVQAVIRKEDFEGIDEEFLKALPRPKKRLTELMFNTANRSQSSQSPSKTWYLHFMQSPKKVEKSGSHLNLTLEENEFDPQDPKRNKVKGTGRLKNEICDIVFRSVGYKGRRIFLDLPFDEATGLIPNVNGKIEPGVYCCGWAAQGPRGVILSTMQNSFDVAKLIVQDMEEIKESLDKKGFAQVKNTIGRKRLTSYKDFVRIAEFEERNQRKVTSVEEMLEIVNGKR